MRHVKGEDRQSGLLFPEYLDDYITGENPVRFLDAFIEMLDMGLLGFSKAEAAETGRKPYSPKDLLKLYVWGYLNRVRSSRRLEVETQRNLEVLWLLKKLRPDDKTISNFRRENAKAIKKVFVEFRMLCQRLELFGEKSVAVDGSKFKADNSKKRNLSQEKLKKRIAEISKEVDDYLSELEKNDQAELGKPRDDVTTLQEKIKQLQERRSQHVALLEKVEETGESQISLTDPDSRSMMSGVKAEVAYNAQVSVDAKHGLIVEYDVTNDANDKKQLLPMALASKEALGVENLEVLADAGYCNPAHIAACEEKAIETFIPPLNTAGMHAGEVPTPDYELDKFQYLDESDTYTCPEGHTLYRIGKARYRTAACKSCPASSMCTKNKEGRIIQRSEHAAAMKRLEERVHKNPEKTKQRGQIVEPVFGTMKQAFGFRAFTLRGKENVNAEFGLVALAFNMRRMLNLVPLAVLMQTIRGAPAQ